MRWVRQRLDETLRKYIQRFNQVRNKVPRTSNEAIIMAFTNGVRDIKMCEKLAINDNITTTRRNVPRPRRAASSSTATPTPWPTT
jgi:hypothetical protein